MLQTQYDCDDMEILLILLEIDSSGSDEIEECNTLTVLLLVIRGLII